MGFDFAEMLQRGVQFLPLLLLSLTFHEFSHAWVAHRLGDDTAERAGRLTLNPIPHIDPIGTLLLPLLGAPIGWARPVPVDSTRFRRDVNISRGVMLTSAAGPISNLLLATVCAVVVGVLHRFAPDVLQPGKGIDAFLVGMMRLNVLLAVFNLLPIPPLDGGHVAEALVPYRMRGAWDSFARVAPFVLLALIFLPMSPLRTILFVPANAFLSFLVQLANAIA